MNNIHTKKSRLTFTVPEEIFQRFAAVVPEGQRSALVSKLIENEAEKRELVLAEACLCANNDAGLTQLEADFQGLPDTVTEEFDQDDW